MRKKLTAVTLCDRWQQNTIVRQTKNKLLTTHTDKYINNLALKKTDFPLIFLPFLCLLFCNTHTQTNSISNGFQREFQLYLFLFFATLMRKKMKYTKKTYQNSTNFLTSYPCALCLTATTTFQQHAIVFVFQPKTTTLQCYKNWEPSLEEEEKWNKTKKKHTQSQTYYERALKATKRRKKTHCKCANEQAKPRG